ncbi:MAG: type II secretion system protein N [Candidatus Omnitrophota bacterium]
MITAKRNIIYLIVFILGVFVARGIFSAISRKPEEPKTTTKAPVVAKRKKKKPSIAPAIKPRKKHPSSVINQTPPTKKDITLPELHLSGIVQSGNQAWAIINNRIVKVGGKIKQAKVTAIYKNKVELIFQGERFSLRVK